MKKKQQAQRGEKGSITTARGQAMKARPGPAAGREGHSPVPPQGGLPSVGHGTAEAPELPPPPSSPRRSHPTLDPVPSLQGTAHCFLTGRNRT